MKMFQRMKQRMLRTKEKNILIEEFRKIGIPQLFLYYNKYTIFHI